MAEQERAFGRHKLDDIEFPDEEKAADSHLVLNTVVDADGTQRQIVRDNMPFGTIGTIGTGEYGTYYIGYSADSGVIEEMLRDMFIGKPPGNHDRILDFSTAVTGGLFFVPTADFLQDPSAFLTRRAACIAPAATPTAGTAPGDGSLGIGSLRRSATP
ncbi:MAG: Dyp-type peroxidase [Streptosporangiaceae bacterium]